MTPGTAVTDASLKNGNASARVTFTIHVQEKLSVNLRNGILQTSNNDGDTIIMHNGVNLTNANPLHGIANTSQAIEASPSRAGDVYTIASP